FLFPNEVARIKSEWEDREYLGFITPPDRSHADTRSLKVDPTQSASQRTDGPTYSTVLKKYYRYSYPFASRWTTPYLSPLPKKGELLHFERYRRDVELDALVEGSQVSQILSSIDDTYEVLNRWKDDIRQNGWKKRYLIDDQSHERQHGATHMPGLPIGGTVVVHYVKNDEHWGECVDVLLNSWDRERELIEDTALLEMMTNL
ncbi:13856_t:CDS:1, partial [Acaulospora colombiana]